MPIELPRQVQAQLLLGQLHLDQGRDKDAFAYFEIAARSGHPVAVNMLGRAYERGWGVSRDPRFAARCFAVAANGGDSWAMFNLADLLLSGRQEPFDRLEAYRLYVRAAQGGNAKALNMIGLLHEDGIAGQPDRESARQFFQAAAEAGDCWGWLNLGRLRLEDGDSPNALPYFEQALDTGFPDVFRALASCLRPYADPALRRLARQAKQRTITGNSKCSTASSSIAVEVGANMTPPG